MEATCNAVMKEEILLKWIVEIQCTKIEPINKINPNTIFTRVNNYLLKEKAVCICMVLLHIGFYYYYN